MAFMDYLVEQYRRANPSAKMQPPDAQQPVNAMAQNTDPSAFQQIMGLFRKPQGTGADPNQPQVQQQKKNGGLFSSLLKIFAGGM